MTKAQLKAYRIRSRRCDALDLEIQLWRSRAERVSGIGGTGSQTNAGNGGMEKAIERIEELEFEYKAMLNALSAEERRIHKAIYSLSDSRHRDVLAYYYLDGIKWDEVAERMGYDLRWVQRLHGFALTAIKPL